MKGFAGRKREVRICTYIKNLRNKRNNILNEKKHTFQLESSSTMSFRIDKLYTNQYLFHCEKSHTRSYGNSRINRNSTPGHKID